MDIVAAQLLWQAPASWPIATAAAVAAIVAVLWLYPAQVKTVQRPWRWMMPGLRAFALLALVTAFVRPATLLPRTVEQQGAIVLLFDRSRSMGVVESGRPPAERVALAAGVGALPPNVRNLSAIKQRRQLDDLRHIIDEAERARNGLDYAALAGRGGRIAGERLRSASVRLRAEAKGIEKTPTLEQLIDQIASLPDAPADAALTQLATSLHEAEAVLGPAQSASDEALYQSNAEVRAACDALDSASRAELADRALISGLLPRIPKGTPVYAFAFDETLSAFPLTGHHGTNDLSLEPGGTRSDITGALQSTFQRLGRLHLQAVILASDGRQVGGTSSGGTPALLSGVTAPVFAVDPAGRLAADLSVARVTVPQRAYVGEMAEVRVDVLGTGVPGDSAEVRLEMPDPALAQTRRVTLVDGRGSTDFSLKLPAAGMQKLRIVALPLPGETISENNAVERWINVVSDTVKVATISPAPSWDYQYARNVLSRTPGVELTDATSDKLTATAAISPAALKSQDIVMLSDVRIEHLSVEQWDALIDLVTHQGGSIILLANDLTVIRQYESDSNLAGLLPYRSGLQASWQSWPGSEPQYHVAPARGASDLALASVGAQSDRGNLFGMFRHLAMPELKAGIRVLLVERQSIAPILTEGRVGAGRAFFVGMSETWRWRRRGGDRYHDRFWLQLVRHASDPPYLVHDRDLWLDIHPLSPTPGEPLTIRARLAGFDGSKQKLPALEVRLSRAGGILVEKALMSLGSGERFESVIAHTPEAGEYEVTVFDPENRARTLSYPLRVETPDASLEMADPTGDPALLKQIAEGSGGRYVPLRDLSTLTDELARLRQRQSTLAEYTLWDSPYLFAFVLACLSGEWALRKRFGLA